MLLKKKENAPEEAYEVHIMVETHESTAMEFGLHP